MTTQITIGVFDSGFGGLTVLRALLRLVPAASYIYLGDTARLPYGSKSRETVARYAVSSARFLVDHGAALLVVACNTATALALDDIRCAVSPIPVIGVIDPGAQAAQNASKPPASRSTAPQPAAAVLLTRSPPQGTKSQILPGPPQKPPASPEILVLATQATVQSHAYTAALARLGLSAVEKACPLLVPLVEEGWIDHPVTRDVARIYLSEALAESPSVHTLLLGCTHYPLLQPLFEQVLSDLDHPLRIINSAEATAHTVAAHLSLFPQTSIQTHTPTSTFYATDSVEKFARLGPHFLGQALPHVHLIELDSYTGI